MAGFGWQIVFDYTDDVIIYTKESLVTSKTSKLSASKWEGPVLRCHSRYHISCRGLSASGHPASSLDISAGESTIEAVRKFAELRNDQKLYFGLCAYYLRFVDVFSIIAHPLGNPLMEDLKHEWSEACQKA